VTRLDIALSFIGVVLIALGLAACTCPD